MFSKLRKIKMRYWVLLIFVLFLFIPQIASAAEFDPWPVGWPDIDFHGLAEEVLEGIFFWVYTDSCPCDECDDFFGEFSYDIAPTCDGELWPRCFSDEQHCIDSDITCSMPDSGYNWLSIREEYCSDWEAASTGDGTSCTCIEFSPIEDPSTGAETITYYINLAPQAYFDEPDPCLGVEANPGSDFAVYFNASESVDENLDNATWDFNCDYYNEAQYLWPPLEVQGNCWGSDGDYTCSCSYFTAQDTADSAIVALTTALQITDEHGLESEVYEVYTDWWSIVTAYGDWRQGLPDECSGGILTTYTGMEGECYPCPSGGQCGYYDQGTSTPCPSGVCADAQTCATASPNTPPSCPTVYNPISGSINQSLDQDISWSGASDPEGDPLTYDVYFGTASPGTFMQNQAATAYDPGTLAEDTTYYWQVKVKDGTNTTDCLPQDFTTISAPISVSGEYWSFATKSGECICEYGSFTGCESGLVCYEITKDCAEPCQRCFEDTEDICAPEEPVDIIIDFWQEIFPEF